MTPDQEQLLKKAYDSLHAARVLDREEMYDFSVSRSDYGRSVEQQIDQAIR